MVNGPDVLEGDGDGTELSHDDFKKRCGFADFGPGKVRSWIVVDFGD